jgi:hypothetical protein
VRATGNPAGDVSLRGVEIIRDAVGAVVGVVGVIVGVVVAVKSVFRLEFDFSGVTEAVSCCSLLVSPTPCVPHKDLGPIFPQPFAVEGRDSGTSR